MPHTPDAQLHVCFRYYSRCSEPGCQKRSWQSLMMQDQRRSAHRVDELSFRTQLHWLGSGWTWHPVCSEWRNNYDNSPKTISIGQLYQSNPFQSDSFIKQTPPHCHYWNISQPWQPLWWSNPHTASLTLHSVTHIHFLSFQWQILNEMPHGVSWSSVWLAANSGLDPVLFWHGSSSSPQSGQLLSEPDSHGPCPTGRRYILKARGTRVAYVLGYLGIIQTVIQNTRTLQLYHRR